MELYLKFFSYLLKYTSNSKLKWNIIFYSVFTLLFLFFILSFNILSPSLSLQCLSISSFFLTTDPSFFLTIDPQTLLSSSETHRRSAWVQPPQTRRRRPTFDHWPDPFRPLFSIFGVSVLCFGLCLCFRRFVFRLCVSGLLVFRICVSGWVDLCFGHGFRCVVSMFG